MREILFKAKRIDNGEWVEGYYYKRIQEKEIVDAIEKCDGTVYSIEYYQIKTETLCQYTGLTDKNGNKIWENDVVYIPYAHLEDTYCKVIFTFGSFIGELADGTHDSILSRNAEVIGNIFDNPELLEGGN